MDELRFKGKLSLTTLAQLIVIIDDKDNWKSHFEPLLGDKGLLQQTRLVVHTRNTICHMSTITEEEHERLKQVMRDWFRVVSP
jgi:HEPN superfamily Swt1-like protein